MADLFPNNVQQGSFPPRMYPLFCVAGQAFFPCLVLPLFCLPSLPPSSHSSFSGFLPSFLRVILAVSSLGCSVSFFPCTELGFPSQVWTPPPFRLQGGQGEVDYGGKGEDATCLRGVSLKERKTVRLRPPFLSFSRSFFCPFSRRAAR